ncbi:hypothetical protein FHT44_004977 [Mycolicibacterium sp. BK634]|uniref:hypothetical protein n=1 Tax=Mycolicibacterium sp. BK634 TaxID=2587099 RepID=UPI00161F84FC|nr:hypothetical protein [Mycolicibacterium sp. BK634]MBB3752465.1 hypothetical protein [Mycolicibacterium sp. BK634]
MGLNTDFDCWNGSYGGFSEFRKELGRASGFNVANYDWDSITNEQLLGHWGDHKPVIQDGIYDPPRHDPILYLLLHQDCEGELEWRHLASLKESLEKLRDSGYPFTDYASEHIDQFIEGLDRAIDAGLSVQFH